MTSKGSIDGQHGLPKVKADSVRILIDGDMPRGVVAWNAEEGWADILDRDEHGSFVQIDGKTRTRRIYGKIEVREA